MSTRKRMPLHQCADCPVKVGDKVYFEEESYFRSSRVNGPYTVVRIKLRPRVVVLQHNRPTEFEVSWWRVRLWTDEVAARQRRELATGTLKNLCWNMRNGDVKPDAKTVDIEHAVAALRAIRKEVPTTPNT